MTTALRNQTCLLFIQLTCMLRRLGSEAYVNIRGGLSDKAIEGKENILGSKVVTAAIRQETNCAGSLSSGDPSEEGNGQQG